MNAEVIDLIQEPPTCSHAELVVLEDGLGVLSFECERCGETWERT